MLDNCFHSFCFICITQWCSVSKTCPLCARKVCSFIFDFDEQTERYCRISVEEAIRSKTLAAVADPEEGEEKKAREDWRKRVYTENLVPVVDFHMTSLVRLLASGGDDDQRRSEALVKADSFSRRDLTVLLVHDKSEQTKQQLLDDVELVNRMLLGIMFESESGIGLESLLEESLKEFLRDNTKIFVRDLLYFIQSPYRTPEEFDGAVQYVEKG